MFSVKVESHNRNGVYGARSVDIKRKEGTNNQLVEIVNEAYQITVIEIEEDAHIWVMNEAGKTVADYGYSEPK